MLKQAETTLFIVARYVFFDVFEVQKTHKLLFSLISFLLMIV